MNWINIQKIKINLYGGKNKNNIKDDDILEMGLTNSSSQIKMNGNKGLNKFNENKNSSRNITSKTPFKKGNKNIMINLDDNYRFNNNNYSNLLSFIKNIK